MNLERLSISRNDFIEALKRAHIGSSVHFIPLHLHPYYRDQLGYRPHDLPTASEAFERIVSLPLFPGMTDDDVDDVVATVRRIVNASRR